MSQQYKSFIQETLNHFPKLDDVKQTDLQEENILCSLEDYIDAGHVNFSEGRKELYRISTLLENYAVKNNSPLLATFETEKRYKYVEDRYLEILSKISKAWIIGNFINPDLAPHPPENAEVISCDGTNISPMWIVATSSEKGPFGLVAEDLGNREYRGFFTSNTNIMQAVIDDINEQLKIKIEI